MLAKKLKAEPGTTVLLEVEGHEPVAATVTDEGRGQLLPVVPSHPTVGLRTDRESFVVLAGGRCRPDASRVEIFGDDVLGQQILDHLAVTP